MKVALYGKKTSQSLDNIFPELFDIFKAKNIEIQIEKEFRQLLENTYKLNLEDINTFSNKLDLWKDLDLFFSFGGDGTILSATTVVQDSKVPIVGINTGRLGYLASINHVDFLPNIFNILDKKFKLSPRSLLSIETPEVELEFPFALNELTVMRKETTSMITVDAFIDDKLINSFWADGLIISTPTGSTGYSLSCNGPIISPGTRNFVITPIAPHNLNVRPLVIPDSDIITLTVHSRVPQYSMSLDSRLVSMNVETPIVIKKADFMVNIAMLEENDYLETLRKKLFWGQDSRN